MTSLLPLLALAACTRESVPPAPQLTGVSPAVIAPGQVTELKLHGEHFTRRLHLELDAPSTSQSAGRYAAALTGPARILLQDVTVDDEQQLSARAPPIQRVGTYSLELVDPWGRRTKLDDALDVAQECVTVADCADDGLACTTARCEATICVHTVSADACVIDGACVAAGMTQAPGSCRACRPQLAQGAWSPVVNGTACDDGDACSLGESCQEGSCREPTAQVTCPAANPVNPCVEAAQCNPATGACELTPRAGACDDGYACTTGDACVAGECRGTPACGNTPPRACFTVSSAAEVSPATFVIDPRCTHDLETEDGALQLRLFVDGVLRSGPVAVGAPLAVGLDVPGAYALQLEVRDPDGAVGYAEHPVLVATAAETLVVTTPAGERDPDATPAVPGGSGFSLDEAVAYANPKPDAGLPGMAAVIRFRAPMVVRPAGALDLQTPQLRLAGRDGLVVDFATLAADPCLRLSGDDVQLVGLELAGCAGGLVSIGGNRARLLDVRARGATGTGISVTGDQARLGPGLVVEGMGGFGVRLGSSTGTVIQGAVVRGNTSNGVEFDSNSNGLLVRSEIVANGGAGVSLVKQNSSGRVWNNTVHGNFDEGVAARQQTGVTPKTVDVRNNLLTSNGAFGVCGQQTRFSALEPNGTGGNMLGPYCSLLDAGVVELDPRYLAPDAGDFRLLSGSAAIDAGVDLGVELPDLNGPAPGRWSGPAPDLGANEVLE